MSEALDTAREAASVKTALGPHPYGPVKRPGHRNGRYGVTRYDRNTIGKSGSPQFRTRSELSASQAVRRRTRSVSIGTDLRPALVGVFRSANPALVGDMDRRIGRLAAGRARRIGRLAAGLRDWLRRKPHNDRNEVSAHQSSNRNSDRQGSQQAANRCDRTITTRLPSWRAVGALSSASAASGSLVISCA